MADLAADRHRGLLAEADRRRLAGHARRARHHRHDRHADPSWWRRPQLRWRALRWVASHR
jgi:hypothetical protein